MIDRISEGEMNQKSIEKFLQTLVEDSEILNCKHFIFFLRADEEAFKKKGSSDFDWVKNLANKFSQNNEFQIKELGLQLKENQPNLSQEEIKKLNIYCDTTERVEKKNHTAIGAINKLVAKVSANYHALSDSIFELSEQFKILAEGFKVIETISGESLNTEYVKQGDLYETLKNTLLNSSQAIKRSGVNMQRHLNPYLKHQEQNFLYLDHVSNPPNPKTKFLFLSILLDVLAKN